MADEKAAGTMFEELNRTHDVTQFASNFTEDVVYVNPVTGTTDKKGMVGFHTGLFQAFPDMNYRVDRTTVQGDAVVAETTVTGTQRGDFAGVPATGKSVTLPIAFVMLFQANKVKEWRAYFDTGTMMRQLGQG